MLETQNDRTLLFDLLPLGFHAPSGFLTKLESFTMTGQMSRGFTRKAVLWREDGIYFASIPTVVQFNKRGLSRILSEREICSRWSASLWSVTFAQALNHNSVNGAGKGLPQT